MASEITLKYLHPSIKTYITTENYNYDTSVSREVLFVADVFDHGVDNKLQQVNTLSEYLFKYGEPNLDKYGQAGYNVEKWLTNGNSAVIMRLLPDDASYAHAILNIQYKNSTNGKAVINADGDETKINDVYLRPLVTYIGVNNTSEALLDSELSEDRSDYPTTDGYIDNFIFIAYPEGRGEYYNDLGFRIRLNSSYDASMTSRIYTFEVIKYSGSTYDIIDGPYYVSFDPDAIDPNSQKSMFIENVVNSYSEYIKIKFNTENYIKLATIINDEVDPYIIDILSGQSRILSTGESETYFSSATGKDEDVHIALRKYSTTGIALQSNGDYILNISNNDETTSDIVDIADNSRRVIYNNQKYVTDYMRGFYNWLLNDRITQNLNLVIGNILSDFAPNTYLLADKVNTLIYANEKDSDRYYYIYNNATFKSNYVGKDDTKDHSWYLRTQEIINKALKDKNGNYVGSEVTGYENVDTVYTSTSQMMSTITEDGYISATDTHLISYYHNFMKYVQFIANYDIYNNNGFVISDDYLEADLYYDYVSDDAKIYSIFNSNSSTTSYKNLYLDTKGINNGHYYQPLTKEYFDGTYKTIYEYIVNNIAYNDGTNNNYLNRGLTDTNDYFPDNKFSYHNNDGTSSKYSSLYPTYIDDFISDTDDDIKYNYIPIVDFTCYDSDGTVNKFGNYIKVYNINGEAKLQPIKGTSLTIGSFKKAVVGTIFSTLIEKYLYIPKTGQHIAHWAYEDKYTIFHITDENAEPLKSSDLPKHTVDGYSYNIVLNYTDDNNEIGYDYTFKDYYDLLNTIYTHFNDNNFNNYLVVSNEKSSINTDEIANYKEFIDNKEKYISSGVKFFNLTNLIRFMSAYMNYQFNIEGNYEIPGTTKKYTLANIPLTSFQIITDFIDSNHINYTSITKLLSNYYFKKEDVEGVPVFDEVFTEKLKNGKLSQCYNKVASYASLISRELDGKGKDTIVDDITNAKKYTSISASDYSLTTILNLFVGGFESIVNNQGSITDYSNYSSLKYLMKTINNDLDLRSTYLTLLNVHKNTVLDLSTDLARNNASVILGDETLDTLYTAMDTIVTETNYLITNIINTVLYQTYKVQDLEVLYKASNDEPYAYYFSESATNETEIDPLGITYNISNYGKTNDDTVYRGILPILEKILINITGQNHYGESRTPIYGGQALIDMYDDIKNGYTVDGLTQTKYETIYQILSESLSQLSDVHNIITAFINEKYITEIINTLIGTIDVANTVIKYNGSSYSVNTLWEYYNSEDNEDLTQTEVTNLINNALEVSLNENSLPLDSSTAQESPVLQYPYYCAQDIINSISIAKENKNIVKSNIEKQDKVLVSLNTLCYDNLVTDINAPLGFAEGSDGCFTYDNSTSAALKLRKNKINDVRIKAYKGTWNEDVLNKDLYEFDHILDANYEDAVKNAIITLARDERQDFFYWADTKVQNTIQDCLDWKTGFTNSTYFMSIISQSQVWYDEYTSKNINLTSTYILADLLGKHIDNYGRHMPMAGSRRGVVGGFISNDWYPNEEQKEKLYTNKVNYLEKDITTIRIGAQNTNYTTGPLGQINNMLVMLRVKRNVEKIAKTYQFEFNTSETRSAMAAEINSYLTNWINNGACTVATADVYASDYDIIQKIVRVDVTLQFTGVIERIVINIDCPASI
jgi:hypothetical protein